MKNLIYISFITTLCAVSFSEQNASPIPPGKKLECSEGWIMLFNGRDLEGWKRHENLPGHGVAGKWYVENGVIVGIQDPPGKGGFLTTSKEFENFEFQCQAKIDWPFDSGIFLRTGPKGKSHQVTLDYRDGGQIGGIYLPWTQGTVHECPDGIKYWKKDQWNKIRIYCAGQPALIQVWLNDHLITNFQHTEKTTANVPHKGGISLQVHPGGTGYDKSVARFKDIRIRPLPHVEDNFTPLFNGIDLTGWLGDTEGYQVENGLLVCKGKNLYTEDTYKDFHLIFDFQLTEGANNGLGVRTPMTGDAAYVGMELQILDNRSPKYANLKPYQYHGSIYGVVPAQKGALKPAGQWNHQEVIADGSHIKVILNGTTILDHDIRDINETVDKREHPGLHNEQGHIAFLGHGSVVKFQNIRIKQLNQ